ncbi:DUF3108 domain-containing protein [Martelella alba]|uniref:DUF3108 domain-containing protein n=1 Tax=Martelella alba TaxID=2590451 RepID=A0A506UDW1_9HYPH|nr:DUF3108 domain-containing protein [Martelella alba]TPW32140.1 DUF3108 domain-containing protein [Martelella alba]
MLKTIYHTFVIVAFSSLLLPQAQAQDETLQTDYTISFSGIKIADAKFKTTLDGDDYAIDGSVEASGLGTLITSLKVDAEVEGALKNGKPDSKSFSLKYRDGDYARDYLAYYRNGRVTQATIAPDPGPRDSNWVEVTSRHLRNVIDPLSAMMLPASANPCQGSLAIFDGETRLELKLAPAGSRPFSTNGFSGRAVGCAMRFHPIAGFERKDEDIDYLAHSTELVVWFALNDRLNVYVPVLAHIPLKIGRITIYATKFGVS